MRGPVLGADRTAEWYQCLVESHRISKATNYFVILVKLWVAPLKIFG